MNKTLFNIIGVLFIILSVLAVILMMVDGVAIIFVLGILMASGFTALTGELRYALIVLLLSTLGVLYFSLMIFGFFQGETNQRQELPDFLPTLPSPNLNNDDFKEISKGSGIPIEVLKKIPMAEENTAKTIALEQNQLPTFLFLLKTISLPYLVSLLSIFIGYRKKQRT